MWPLLSPHKTQDTTVSPGIDIPSVIWLARSKDQKIRGDRLRRGGLKSAGSGVSSGVFQHRGDCGLVFGVGLGSREHQVRNQDLNLVSKLLTKTELPLSSLLSDAFQEVIQCDVAYLAVCAFVL